jgi:hypothetical protein
LPVIRLRDVGYSPGRWRKELVIGTQLRVLASIPVGRWKSGTYAPRRKGPHA